MKTRYLASIFILIIFGFTSSASAQSAFKKFKSTAAMEKSDLKLPPTNAFEFIQNVRYGIESDLFLKDYFFERQYLMRFANAKLVDTLGSEQDWLLIRKIDIKGVTGLMEAIRDNTKERKMTRLAIQFYPLLIHVEDFLENFGPISSTADPYMNIGSDHPMPLSAKTHPYGNLQLHQAITKGKVITKIISTVSGDGFVSEFNVIQIRKN